MSLKKYEIITVGSDRRVRALRSWAVGDRYVNIGDVGGIVYDENTLSQDGLCWLFRGNFGFPGARIGGDSIVDVAEAALADAGAPNVDILGSSVVVGSKLQFASERTEANAVVLTAADFEQGTLNFAAGSNWESMKASSSSYLRTKAPIFNGGLATTVLKLDVPGYTVQAYVLDRDGKGVTATAATNTGVGVTLAIPAGQYFMLTLAKNPAADIVPADATAAAITFTGLFDTKLVVIDSRLEINPVTSTGTVIIRPGGFHPVASGAKYPDSVIRNSKVVINGHATADRVVQLISEFAGCNVVIDATLGQAHGAGVYSNVKNLTFTGSLVGTRAVNAHFIIQATDCDNFAVSPTIFPGLAAAQTANMPFIFQGCNVPNGIFYHHAQIANTYKNIDFALAQADLGKKIPSTNYPLVSSEVEGMYRYCNTFAEVYGFMVESFDSVKSLGAIPFVAATYGTTIYKDAYFNGIFDLAGTNVFGNKVRSHPLAQVLNVQPRAVQGGFTLTAGQPPVPSTESTRVRTEKYFRINGASGMGVQNIPAGVEGRLVYLDGSGNYAGLGDWYTGSVVVPTVSLVNSYAYILFRKTGDAAITPEDLAGVTVTVYNGCKIVNTGATAVNMKGNIRVEDNAILINANVVGSGYFGGNAVASGLRIGGAVFMSDNASFAKTGGGANIRNLKMTDNAKAVIGDVVITGSVHIKDNAVFTPANLYVAEADFYLQDNAKVTADVSVNGSLFLKDNAAVNQTLTVIGDVTLCGSYNQTALKMWTGKRVIDNENEPEYDNNVKTQYDF